MDFGIAQIAGLDPLTDDSKILGTLDFLDPELFRGHHASPATDLWALAVTLYWALEGRSPFRGKTTEATIAAILSKNPPEPLAQPGWTGCSGAQDARQAAGGPARNIGCAGRPAEHRQRRASGPDAPAQGGARSPTWAFLP